MIKKIVEFIDFRLELVRKFINILVIFSFGMLVLVVFSQVIWRFVFNNPFSWTEELARILQVWLVLLTSSICIRKGSHLSIDYAIHALPFKYKKVLKLIVMLFIMFYLLILIIYGSKLIMITINQTTAAMRVPIYVVYLAFPIGGFLMFLESLLIFLKSMIARNEIN